VVVVAVVVMLESVA